MYKVFLSYARKDREVAKLVAKRLTDKGYDVIWDTRIPSGQNWSSWILQSVGTAHAVVVLWSRASVGSEYVQHEADVGAKRGILVPATTDDVDKLTLPLGRSRDQCPDLSGLRGGDDAGMDQLLAGVAAAVERHASPLIFPTPDPPNRLRRLTHRRLIVAGSVSLFLLVGGALGYAALTKQLPNAESITRPDTQHDESRTSAKTLATTNIQSKFRIPAPETKSTTSGERKTLPDPEVEFGSGNGGKFTIRLTRLPKGRAHYSLDGTTYRQFMMGNWTEFSELPPNGVVHLKFISQVGEEGPYSFPFDAGALNRAALNKYAEQFSQNYARARSLRPNPAFDLIVSVSDSSATFIGAAPRQPVQCQIRYESDFWETYPASPYHPWGCIIPRSSELFTKYTHRSPVHVRLIYEGGEKTPETSFSLDLATLVRRHGVHGAFDGSNALMCSEGRVVTAAPNRTGMNSPSDYKTLARCEPSGSWKNIRSIEYGATARLGRSIDTGDNSVAIVRAIGGQRDDTPRSERMKACSEGRASAGCLPFPPGTEEMYARFRLQDGTQTEVYRYRFSGR